MGEARLGGAGGGNRTPDPLITNQPLYLLSYASGQKVIIFKVPTLGKLFFVIPWKAGRRTPRSPKGAYSTPGAEPLSTGTRAGGYVGHPRGIAPAHGLPHGEFDARSAAASPRVCAHPLPGPRVRVSRAWRGSPRGANAGRQRPRRHPRGSVETTAWAASAYSR